MEKVINTYIYKYKNKLQKYMKNNYAINVYNVSYRILNMFSKLLYIFP